jgi:hypothetical protein
VATHARLGRRQAGESARFDRRMAVAAVDTKLIDVVSVTEGYGLGPYLVLPGNVGGRK